MSNPRKLSDIYTFLSHDYQPTSAEWRQVADLAAFGQDYERIIVNISPGGGGDYTTPEAFLAGTTDATTSKRYVGLYWPGTYTTTGLGLTSKDYVDHWGASQEEVVFKSSGDALSYVVQFGANCMWGNMTWIAVEGSKYAIHIDHAGLYIREGLLLRNIRAIHREVKTVVGCGGRPGMKVTLDGCTILGHMGIHGDAFTRVGPGWRFNLIGSQFKSVHIQDFGEIDSNIVYLAGTRIEQYLGIEYDADWDEAEVQDPDSEYNRGFYPVSVKIIDGGGNKIGYISKTVQGSTFTTPTLFPILPSVNMYVVNKGAGTIAAGEAVKRLVDPAAYGTLPVTEPNNDLPYGNVAKWDGSGIFVGFAEHGIAVDTQGSVAHSGTPQAMVDISVAGAIAYGDELELNSAGRLIKRSTGRLIAHALEAKSTGSTGIITVALKTIG